MIFLKDPDSVLDYKFDWAPWLPDNDTIDIKTVTVVRGDVVIDSSSITDNGTSVTVWLSAGSLGVECTITCHIVTVGGREEDQSMTILIQEK